jgi:hypothetical protein
MVLDDTSYVAGETMVLNVTYRNTGGTDALNVDSTLDFGGNTDLTPSNPAAITVPAHGNASQIFTITIDSAAATATVNITASATGSENITSRSLSANSSRTVGIT